MKLKVFYILFCFLVAFFSCKKKNTNTPEKDTFNKQALLVQSADQIILPAYQTFKKSLDSLVIAYDNFKLSGSLSDFQSVKIKYAIAYLNYQNTSLFEFGPAETAAYRMNFNVFPTDTNTINNNISNGSYNLEAASNLSAKGLPALDFLFHRKNKSETSVLAEFNSNANLKQYVSDVLSNMSIKLNTIINTWNSSYKNTFINSLGTDVGSSIGFLVNQLNFELDYLKNAKIGTPLGKKTLGIALPEKCEAYYSSQSLSLAIQTLKIIEDTYTGKDGIGFDDYLVHLGASYNGGALNSAIENQFSITKTKLNAIQNPLSSQVVSNASQVDAAYAELVKLLVLLKTDMPSSLGVIITYQDGDGD